MLKCIVILVLFTVWEVHSLCGMFPENPLHLKFWTARYKGKEYMFVYEWKNWFGAMHHCAAHGMDLASVDDLEENDFLTLQIQNRNAVFYYWLGGNNLETRKLNEMRWVNTGKKMIYTDWAPRQPDNAQGQENCVHLFHFDVPTGVLSMGWNDSNCYKMYPFICKQI